MRPMTRGTWQYLPDCSQALRLLFLFSLQLYKQQFYQDFEQHEGHIDGGHRLHWP